MIFTLTVLIFWPHIHASKPEPLINYPVLSKLLIGIKFGLVGLLTAWLSLPYEEGLFINAWVVPLLFCGLLGGPIAILCTAFLMIVGRIVLLEVFLISTFMTVNFLILAIVISIAAHFRPIHYHNIQRYLSFSLIEISIALLIASVYTGTNCWKFIHLIVFSWLIFMAIKMVLVQSQYARGKVELSMLLDQKDYLTQLPNNYAIEAKLKNHALREQSYAFLFIVIDHFKHFNVHYSYLVGDSILKELAQMLRQFAEENNAQIGRLGGEEFCCILKDTPPALAVYQADKFRQFVENHTFGRDHGIELSVTVSIGITNVPENAATSEEIFRTANRAISSGHNNPCNYVCHINQYNKN